VCSQTCLLDTRAAGDVLALEMRTPQQLRPAFGRQFLNITDDASNNSVPVPLCAFSMGTSSSKEKSCCCSGSRGEDRFPKSSPSHDLTGRQYLLIDADQDINLHNLAPPNSTLPTTAHTTSSFTKTSHTTLLPTNCTTNRIYSQPEQKTDENTKPTFASNKSLSLTKQALQNNNGNNNGNNNTLPR